MTESIMYTKNNCMQCKMMKRLLAQKGIEFKEINVDEDAVALEELKAQGYRSVPVFFSPDQDPIVGFAPDKVKDLVLS
ncbi:glutaredoxin-like protein NrdH [Holzapfeliella sp. JNUCC 80]